VALRRRGRRVACRGLRDRRLPDAPGRESQSRRGLEIRVRVSKPGGRRVLRTASGCPAEFADEAGDRFEVGKSDRLMGAAVPAVAASHDALIRLFDSDSRQIRTFAEHSVRAELETSPTSVAKIRVDGRKPGDLFAGNGVRCHARLPGFGGTSDSSASRRYLSTTSRIRSRTRRKTTRTASSEPDAAAGSSNPR
jgi:hypothetical protein